MPVKPTRRKNRILSINVSFSDAIRQEALDGRLLLMFSNNGDTEPRFQINDGLQTQMIFGMNVDGMKAGESKTFDGDIFGFPYPSLAEVPPGEYSVQALLTCVRDF